VVVVVVVVLVVVVESDAQYAVPSARYATT